MKKIIVIIIATIICGCSQSTANEESLTRRVDSLQSKLADAYKPGFGEFMSSIQAHHAKLWFAGQNENWQLCDFEIHEIMENIEDIKKYETDRKESQLIDMINPSIDTLNAAIQKKDPVLFRNGFVVLTNTCNNCHKVAKFGFNVVKIPETQTFSNQDFKLDGK